MYHGRHDAGRDDASRERWCMSVRDATVVVAVASSS